MNDPVDPEIRSRAMAAAQGHAPFDLLFSGGTVVDVATGELRPADVGVVGPLIASVHPTGSRTDAAEVVDVTGRFVAPGFMDLHVHTESAMLTPGGYAEAVCPGAPPPSSATPTSWPTSPASRVSATSSTPPRACPSASSSRHRRASHPSPGSSSPGADLHGPEVEAMLAWPEVGGLAEVMDMLGVLTRDRRMVDVVAAGLASGKLVSGHAAGLTGPELQGYLCAGIESDHEIFTDGDVMEKLRAGMTVEFRGMIEGLIPRLVEELDALPELPVNLVLATDDLFALTLLTDGGLDHLLRRLVAAGMDPVRAIRLCTHHAALRLRRTDLGVVGAGRRADLVVLSDLDQIVVDDVYTDGRHVAHAGEMVVAVVEGPSFPPLDTMRLDGVTRDDMVLHLPGLPDGTHRLRTVVGSPVTVWGEADVEVHDGIAGVPEGHILQVAVHRHGRAPATPIAAVLAGWGDWTGAVATTFSHDTHNLVVFGRDADDMTVAANAVIASGGGVAVVRGGEVVASIELSIGGILSPLPAAEVAAAQDRVQRAALEIGLNPGGLTQPLLQCLAASLACLGGPHVTDIGLVDGTTGELVPTMVV